MASLLLVDSSVRMYTQIVEAAKPSTVVIVFNRLTSSLDDIVAQIAALPNQSFTSVGLVQDGTNRMMNYRIVDSQAPCALQNLEVDGLASWSPVIAFLQSIQSLTGMTTFDFISCLLNANPGFSYAISQISAQLGVTLQASSDETGNLAQGGNWVQESDAVNIKDVYFTDAIVGYTGLLYIDWYSLKDTEMKSATNTGCVNSAKPVLDMITFASGTICSWGNSNNGGTGAPIDSGYTAIASSQRAFAALKNGTIYAWGLGSAGGSMINGVHYNDGPFNGAPLNSGYTAIASNDAAFAALKSDNTIQAWGHPAYGGTGVITGSGYIAIASTWAAFAALKSDKTIYAWGYAPVGGRGAIIPGTGYTSICACRTAFAALNASGQIYVWGDAANGGAGATIPGTGYIAVVSTNYGFAALKSDTTIYTWTLASGGGSSGLITGTGYTAITSTQGSFAALKSDNTIYAWGTGTTGGTGAPSDAGYIRIAANGAAFSALKSDNTICTWGSSPYGGGTICSGTMIASTWASFATLKADTKIFAWGYAPTGGSGAPAGSGYTSIASAVGGAFAALKSDGSISAWGDSAVLGSGAPAGTGYTSIFTNRDAFAAITSVAPPNVACFVKGTRLLSQNGYKAIDKFSSTDLLITSDGRTVDFELLSTTIAKTDEDTAPYVIHPHAFGRNVPIAPLYLSPTHMVMFRKGLWTTPAIAVLTNPLVKRCPIGESVTYYHVKCEDFLKDNVLAEGMVAESLGTKKGLGNVKIIYTWNKKLGGYTRIAPRAMLKNKASSTA